MKSGSLVKVFLQLVHKNRRTLHHFFRPGLGQSVCEYRGHGFFHHMMGIYEVYIAVAVSSMVESGCVRIEPAFHPSSAMRGMIS